MAATTTARPPVAEVFFGSVVAELTTKTVLHPFDTLKTRLQYLVVPKRSAAVERVPIVSDVRLAWRIMKDSTRSPHHSLVDAAARGRHDQLPMWQSVNAVGRSLCSRCIYGNGGGEMSRSYSVRCAHPICRAMK